MDIFQAGGIVVAKFNVEEVCLGCCRNSEEACEAGTVSEGEHRGGEGRGVTGADYARPCGLWESFAIYK